MTTRSAETMPVLATDWEARGYHGSGNVAELIGSIEGRNAIICGNGAGVFDQLEDARAVLDQPVIFAVNDVGQYVPNLDHWCSLHTDNLGPWKSVRWLNCKSMERTVYHGVDARPHVDYVWDQLSPCFALSGYFAMQLAWIMGATRIVLCGCPGTATRRFFEAKARADFGYGQGTAGSDEGVRLQIVNEMARVPGFRDAVRSLSGWTKDFFGDDLL